MTADWKQTFHKRDYVALIVSVVVALLFWPLDVWIDVGYIYDREFLEELFDPSPTETYFRGVLSLLILLLGIVAHFSLRQRKILRALVQSNADRNESDVRKSVILNSTYDCIICVDENECILEFNRAAEKTFNYKASDVRGENACMLLIANASHNLNRQNNRFFTSSEMSLGVRIENIGKRSDGSEFPIDLAVTHSKSGFYIISMRDITSEKETQERLQHAQKMQAVGTLVGGIAHDFNNILAGLVANLHLVRTRVEDAEVLDRVNSMDKLSLRAADTIQQLLAFSSKAKVQKERLDLMLLLEQTMKFVRPSIPENIAFRQGFIKEKVFVFSGVTQIQQVLMNLINNARDAVESNKHPEIIVKVDTFVATEVWQKKHPESVAGKHVIISVSDNGEGIAEENMPHLFDPFFTTKEQGKGTGLGLAMVYGCIKSHQGIVEVISKQGEGATFNIYLPIDKLAHQDVEIAPKEDVVRGREETILLVDDEQSLRETLRDLLKSYGYKVLVAVDGVNAVEVFDANQDNISLVLTDVVMPRMNGDEAVARILEMKPNVKVIFSTGYDKHAGLKDKPQFADFPIIEKPYAVHVLSQMIRAELDDISRL